LRGPTAVVATGDGPIAEVLATGEGQSPWGNFHLATVIFRRALQLRGGARPRVIATGHKPTHVAFLEVTAGVIPWESTTGKEDA
jgi:DNA-directed RNA polymerase subunit K/omega